MLWVDKYRPRVLDKMTVHEEIAQSLKKLVSEQDCPHLLFYGPPGSGKKTMVMALLKEMFGVSVEKVKLEQKTWKIDAGTRTIELELAMLASTHHVEMNPSDAGFQDRYIVQEIIKEMTKNRPIDSKGKKGFKDQNQVADSWGSKLSSWNGDQNHGAANSWGKAPSSSAEQSSWNKMENGEKGTYTNCKNDAEAWNNTSTKGETSTGGWQIDTPIQKIDQT